MRSTTFDQVAMVLMALAVVLITGGMTVWAYVQETRGGKSEARTRDAPVER